MIIKLDSVYSRKLLFTLTQSSLYLIGEPLQSTRCYINVLQNAIISISYSAVRRADLRCLTHVNKPIQVKSVDQQREGFNNNRSNAKRMCRLPILCKSLIYLKTVVHIHRLVCAIPPSIIKSLSTCDVDHDSTIYFA